MRRVLLLATTTGYQTRAFGEAADTLGVRLAFATDRCHMLDDPWRDEAIAIRFHDEEGSASAIVEAARRQPIDGLLTVGDRPTTIAARVAERLGLPWHPVEGTVAARDKQRTRERLRAARLPVPWFVSARLDDDPPRIPEGVSYPCVLKPVALSGSRGVMRADSEGELASALERLRALLRRPDLRAERNDAHERILIEEFVPGREFALEGILHHGRLKVLALFDKPDPLDGPFFEETVYLTPSSLDAGAQRLIADEVTRAVEAIGLRHGPIHAECRLNERGVFVLEVAARPIGGLCARALRFTAAEGLRTSRRGDGRSKHHRSADAFALKEAPISLEELLLRQSLGESPDRWSRETAASGLMMIPIPSRGIYRGVAGEDEARAVPGICDLAITAKVDQLLEPLPEGASYLGFIFARGDVLSLVEQSLRDAHARLRFRIDLEVRLVDSRDVRM